MTGFRRVQRAHCVVVACVVACASIARGQLPSDITREEHSIRPPRTAGNAAWVYLRAWDLLPDPEERGRFFALVVAPADAGTHGTDPATGRHILDKEQRAALTLHRDFIGAVMAASAMPTCEWGSAEGDGPFAVLPHLRYLRSSWRVLRCDGLRCLEDHDPQGAAERVVACLRMAQHAACDRFLISNLVADGMVRNSANEVEEFLPLVTPAAARAMLVAIRPMLAAPDFLNFNACFEFEIARLTPWFRRECRGERAGVEFLRLLSGVRSRWIPEEFYAHLDEARLRTELDRADAYLAAVRAAWGRPNAMVSLRELEAEADEGQWGLTTPLIFGRLTHHRFNSEYARAALQRTEAKLRGVVRRSEDARAGGPSTEGAR